MIQRLQNKAMYLIGYFYGRYVSLSRKDGDGNKKVGRRRGLGKKAGNKT